MKQEAPELSALITILRSGGPVISTRRSSRSFGSGATVQSPSRMAFGLRQEVGLRAGIEPHLPLVAQRQQPPPLGIELPLEVDDEGQRLRRQDRLIARPHGPENLHALHVKSPVPPI